MKTILTIWKREMKGYFYTPLAYVFCGVFSLIVGLLLFSFFKLYSEYTMRSQFGMSPTITIDRLAEAFYQNLHIFLMMFLPFFTMRVYTEEYKQNTFALLMTSPIKTIELTLAKFLASSSMLAVLLVTTMVFPFFLLIYSAPGPNSGPDNGIIFASYVGLFLTGLAYIAIGNFWSSITESQLVSLLLTFGTIFGLWLFSPLSQGQSGVFKTVLAHLALIEQLNGFLKGSIELSAVVFLCSLIFFALFLTNRSLESKAWKS